MDNERDHKHSCSFNFMNISFLKIRSIRCLVCIVFLTAAAGGAYYYTHREAKLTFHPDWTEADRRQMQEIMGFITDGRAKMAELKSREWRKFADSLSMNRLKKWDKLWEDFRQCWRMDSYLDPYSWDKIVISTARTGNARYVGKENWTLLHLACGLGKKELAGHLIDKGAEVNKLCKVREKDVVVMEASPFHWVLWGGMDKKHPMDKVTILYLMEKLSSRGANFNDISTGLAPSEAFCLWVGNKYAKEDQEEILSKMIELGVDVVSPVKREEKQVAPLYLPIRAGQVEFVRRLCKEGADVNKGYDSRPPLFAINVSSPYSHQLEIARILFDYGARINERTDVKHADSSENVGQTPLAYVCFRIPAYEYGFNEIHEKYLFDLVSLYLEKKADVNLASAEGMTPLMYLFRKEVSREKRDARIMMARMLLKHGADPNLKNNQGETVLDMIRKYTGDEKEILPQLLELQPGKSKEDDSQAK